jgi:hypothetical protein
MSVNGDSHSHTIIFSGRNKVADVLDSSLPPISDIPVGDGFSLKQLIEKIIFELQVALFGGVTEESGIDEFRMVELIKLDAGKNPVLKVIEETRTNPFTTDGDNISSISIEGGNNAFDLIDKYARFRQVLLTCTAEGDILIVRPPGDNVKAWVTHRKDIKTSDTLNSNNVLSYSVTEDFTQRFPLYIALSQGGGPIITPTVIGTSETGSNRVEFGLPNTVTSDLFLSKVPSDATRNRHLSRPRRHFLTLEAESTSQKFAQRRIEWEKNIRIARGFTYGATVPGFTNQSGDIWRVNTLVTVKDEFAGITPPRRMLVNSIIFSMTPEQGKNTTIAFVEKDVYGASEDIIAKEEQLLRREALFSGIVRPPLMRPETRAALEGDKELRDKQIQEKFEELFPDFIRPPLLRK